jgi:MFS family permease
VNYAAQAGSLPAGDAAPTSARAPTALEEWRANWTLVLTSAFGMSLAMVVIFTNGLFFEPLEHEFGWSRAEASSGMTIYAAITVLLAPFVGKMIDRWGGRRIAIPGVIIFGIMFAALSLSGPSIISFWVLWVGVALAALGIMPTLWIMTVSSRFEASRGLAIALCMSGSAICSFFAPLLSRWLIDVVGWRLAYIYIGLGWSALVLLLIVPFLKTRSAPAAALVETGAVPALPGLTFREATRNRAFQKLAIASLLLSISIAGTLVHLVPMLTMRGLSREAAAGVLSIVGVTSAVGKVITGWLFDRIDARAIASLCLALPAVPLLTLALAPEGHLMPISVAMGSVALLGFAIGAEQSVTAYLTTRYVGLRAFAQNYAVITSIMAFSWGIGPLVAGLIYDWTSSYTLLLFSGIPASLLAGLFMASMGPYPIWKQEEERTATTEAPSSTVFPAA